MSRLETGFRDVDAAGDVESYADYLSTALLERAQSRCEAEDGPVTSEDALYFTLVRLIDASRSAGR